MQFYKENPNIKPTISKQLEEKSVTQASCFQDYSEILTKTDLYLNEKNEELKVGSLSEAQLCFQAMKEIYNSRMKEYVTELTFISEKLKKYDEILSKKLID